MKTGRLLIKNFFSLATGELFARIVGFITTAYLCRTLGAAGYGKLGFVQSIQSYFLIFALLGLNSYGVREIAKHKDNYHKLVGEIVGIKIVTTFLSFAFLVIVAIIIPRPDEIRWLMIVLAFSLFTNGLSFEWIFSGMEMMGRISIIGIIRNILYAVLVFALIHSSSDLYLIVAVILIPEFIAVMCYYVLYTRHAGKLTISIVSSPWRTIVRASLPMALSSILVQIYYNFDVVLLGFWTTDRTTGLYASAYKIILVVIGVGHLVSSTLYPTVSRLYKDRAERVQELLRFTGRMLITISLPIAVGGTLLSVQILTLIFGVEYSEGAPAFQILIWSVVTVFSNIPYAISLLACDRQRQYMIATFAGAAVNIFFNILWIRTYQLLGAAYATIIAEACVFLILYYYGRRIVEFSIFKLMLKPVVASALMGWFIVSFKGSVEVNILIAGLIYFASLVVLKGITVRDLNLIQSYFKKENLQ